MDQNWGENLYLTERKYGESCRVVGAYGVFPLFRDSSNDLRRALLALGMLMGIGDASAVLFYDSGDSAYNTTAPTGIYEDAGWQYQGQYGSYLGTMIAPQYFITAQHFGTQGGSFVHSGVFNGGADMTYTIDTAANGGIGYWDIAGTDLRVLRIQEYFPYYAPLYTGSLEVGKTLLVTGRGGVRGDDVLVSGVLHGWKHTGSDGVSRWGTNVVSAAGGGMLSIDFDAAGSDHEATLSVGDSGGAVFIEDGGLWKLAGINYGIDGMFDTNNTPGDGSEFQAALFDAGGLYYGGGSSWTLLPDRPQDNPTSFYASRISSSAAAISSIASVPEPAGGLLLMCAASTCLTRRVRRRE